MKTLIQGEKRRECHGQFQAVARPELAQTGRLEEGAEGLNVVGFTVGPTGEGRQQELA